MSQITRWTSSGWNSWIAVIPWVNNYTIHSTESYFIMIEGGGQCTWDVSGYGHTEPQTVQFQRGWNAIGVPYHTAATQTASDVASQIEAQNGAGTFQGFANWTGGGWQIYAGEPADDFELDVSLKQYYPDTNPVGYFVCCSKSGAWTPQ